MLIELSGGEMLTAATIGVRRQIENLQRGRRDQHGARHPFQIHIEGAMGEMAFAKAMGLFWSGAHSFRATDVGNYEVRTSSMASSRLILHPKDADDRTFVLVHGSNGKYQIMGQILGRDGKREEYWDDPTGAGRPAFFVPLSALEPISQLGSPQRS